jgi:molybdate transport system substrate-binding protein
MATIRILSGGAPQAVFKSLTPQFEAETGHKVEFVFAVMSALRDRLTQGETADVLVMPTNILDNYEKQGVVRAQGRAVLGLVSVNAVVRTGAAKPDLSSADKVRETILNSRKVVFSTPGATPSGTHLGKLIEKWGIGDAMGARIIHRPALQGGVELVTGGEADIGFYPKSEIINTPGLELAGPLPPGIQLTTIYGAAVTGASAVPEAAASFIAFMADHAKAAQWRHAGFEPPAR